MPIKFTERGYLDPSERQELSLEEFEEHFVKAFPKSQTREKLFNGYLKYTKDFREDVTTDIIQWVGGSFSSKKLNPPRH